MPKKEELQFKFVQVSLFHSIKYYQIRTLSHVLLHVFESYNVLLKNTESCSNFKKQPREIGLNQNVLHN